MVLGGQGQGARSESEGPGRRRGLAAVRAADIRCWQHRQSVTSPRTAVAQPIVRSVTATNDGWLADGAAGAASGAAINRSDYVPVELDEDAALHRAIELSLKQEAADRQRRAGLGPMGGLGPQAHGTQGFQLSQPKPSAAMPSVRAAAPPAVVAAGGAARGEPIVRTDYSQQQQRAEMHAAAQVCLPPPILQLACFWAVASPVWPYRC